MKDGKAFITTLDVHYLLNTPDTLVGLLLMEKGFLSHQGIHRIFVAENILLDKIN